LSSLVVPVVGVLAAWLQLAEQPSAAEGLGIVLILVALGVLIFNGEKASATEAEIVAGGDR
jgi:drug/metabolite transporter (DMT)-like permease